MKQNLIMYWSRRDFRLRDNRALGNAVNRAKETDGLLLPVFIIEPYMTSGDPSFQFGYPSRYFLAQTLPLFAQQFPEFAIIHDKPVSFFKRLAKKYTIEIYVNEDIHPDFYVQIRKIREQGISIKLFRDQMTVSKETVTGSGKRYSVFTPFKNSVWKSFVNEHEDKTPSFSHVNFADSKHLEIKTIAHDAEKILGLFSKKEACSVDDYFIDIKDMKLPSRNLEDWYYSEEQALLHFKTFLKKINVYKDARDILADDGTSKMSLALTWGLVSARTLVALIKKHSGHTFENPLSSQSSLQGSIHFISELIWREFYKYLYFHNPKLFSQPFQEKFNHIKWVPKKLAQQRFSAWIQGKTGYPIVDAAMMQLVQTGWMHNRARMIVASVLTKNLGVDWRWGQEYFRAMLIDLDEASNNGGWQWSASVGADPKPIRIFNPYLQAKNYDSNNTYQNTWLSDEYRLNPPKPIVPHEEARADALNRYGL